jgi:hypothetical protein
MAQLVAGNWLLDGERVLEASDPNPRALNIELVAPHLDGLGGAPATTVDHQQ